MREPRLLVAGMALVLMSAACGDGKEVGTRSQTGGGARGRLSVVHEDDSDGTPVEGALTVVTVQSQWGETLYDDMVQYPLPPEVVGGRLPPRRYDLLRDVELPVGPVVLRFDVRMCSMSCPDRRTAKPDDPFLGKPEGVCELALDVTEWESREVVVVWESAGPAAKTPCRLAS